MKALFYGGAIASLAGLALGMGMEPAAPLDPEGADAQPIAQLMGYNNTPEQGVGYGSAAEAYPPAYVVNAAYMSEPVTDLRDSQPAYDDAAYQQASYEQPPADQLLQASWSDAPAPRASPQDVAAAGDTTAPESSASEPAPTPRTVKADAQVRTFASIDALLAQQQAEQPSFRNPSF
jgi:hypothetical protein